MKKYILTYEGVDQLGNVMPHLSPKEFKKSVKMSLRHSLSDFLPNNVCFTPLIPRYIGDYVDNSKIEKLSDFCDWIEIRPKGIKHPISEKLKEVLEKFDLGEHRFYNAEVFLQGELLPFYIFHVLPLKYCSDILIDFKHSTFCNFDSIKRVKLGEEHIQVNKFDELREIRRKHKWHTWGYNRAFVKPKFHELDWIRTHAYGTLISEELKETIEAADITGVKIKPCPTDFQIYKEQA